MKKTFNVWIPSIQNFLRFCELSSHDYSILLKALDDNDIDFSYTLNDIIKNNLISTFDFSTLTTLDRFVIFLALKINSCGSMLVLSSNCPECSTKSTIEMDLNILVDNLGERIDRSFKKTIKENLFTICCDIPSIDQDYKILEYGALKNISKTSIDFLLDNHLVSHIKGINLGEHVIDMHGLSYEDQIVTANALPVKVVNAVRNSFLNDLHSLVSDFDFLKIKCSNKKCACEMEVKFDISNINDIIKIIYRDSTYLSLISEMVVVSDGTHLGGDFISNMAPIDVRKLAQQLNSANSAQHKDSNSSTEQDLFDEYANQTQGMQKSPSEFNN